MSSWQQIESAISDWLETSTGLPCYYEAQIGARPAAYHSIGLRGTSRLGAVDEVQQTDFETDSLMETIPRRELHVTVQTFTGSTVSGSAGRTALDYLSLARDASELTSNTDRFNAAGLAIWDATDVRAIPAPLGEAWQSRAFVDLIFGLTQDFVSERIPWVASADGTMMLYFPWKTGA